MEALRASSAREVIKDLLLFIVLTGARLSEAAETCWSEIDFDDSVWTLSKKRMKAGRQHQVPLSVQALEILRRLRERGHPGPFVFRFRPSRGPDRPVTGESLLYWLRNTQPTLPMGLGYAEGYTHDYVRHGTTTLFAALDIATGQVFGHCRKRHRHEEFLSFLRLIDREVPAELDIHLVLDNYATHKHAKVKRWLAARPRFHLHFTPGD